MLNADQLLAALKEGATTLIHDPARQPTFAVGQAVVTRNLNPPTHTRLARYCRDKSGVIVKVHGLYALPDKRALGDELTREWCYAVRFSMRELWGVDAPAGDSLTIDLWDSYLLPAPAPESSASESSASASSASVRP